MRFENFIVDESNEFAYKVSLAIAEIPCIYNPLIINGASGYGKTHLINAIKYVMEEKHGLNVLMTECNDLIETWIATFKNNECVDLYDCFKDFDVIIVENIQDLRGKQSTQFKVARATCKAVQENKQVIFTSAKPIQRNVFMELEGYLKDRCPQMVEITISSPSYELKKQYLEYLMKMEEIELLEDEKKMIVYSTATIHQVRMILKQAILYSKIKKSKINKEVLLLMLEEEKR